MSIKPATAADLPHLIPLINASFNNSDGQGAGWTHAAAVTTGPRINPEDPFELETIEGKSTILKYEDENQKILGCVKLEIVTKDGEGQGTGHRVCDLGLLSVLPNIQSKGVGSKLLEVSEEWAIQNGCSIIEISVTETMVPLIEYYERRGYVRTGTKKAFPLNPGSQIPIAGLHMIFMEKVLG